MIRFDNVPPEVMQAMCTPMHPILAPPSSSSTPISPTSSSSSGGLYLGSLAALSDVPALRAARITHLVQILDVPWLPPLQQQGFVCYQIKIDDTEDENKVDLRKYLKDTTNWIEGVIRQGGGVLVHCQQGVSRSPAIVIAFLMRFRGMSFDAAYAYTKRCRACIKPNSAFMRALRDWEGITGTASSPVGVPAGAYLNGSGGSGGMSGGPGGGPGAGGYKLQLPPGKNRAASGMQSAASAPSQQQQQYLQQQQMQAQQAQQAYQQQQQLLQQQQAQQQPPPVVSRPPLGRRYTS